MKKLVSFILCLLCFAPLLALAEEDLHLFMDIPFGIAEEEFRAEWKKFAEGNPDLVHNSTISRSDDGIKIDATLEIYGDKKGHYLTVDAFFDRTNQLVKVNAALIFMLGNGYVAEVAEKMSKAYSDAYGYGVSEFGKPTEEFLVDFLNSKTLTAETLIINNEVQRNELARFFNEECGEYALRIEWDNVALNLNIIPPAKSEVKTTGSFLALFEFSPYSTSFLDDNNLTTDVSKASGNRTLSLSIGEWVVGQHIPAGEYSVKPVKSASIAVYKTDGSLKITEYLSTNDNDEIGRIVLSAGDSLEIGSGKLEFMPFK